MKAWISNALTMAEFLITDVLEWDFQPVEHKAKVSCCPSITLVTGADSMSGATKSE